MNRLILSGLTGIVILANSALVQSQPAGVVFRGEISDSQCAFNVHSLTKSHEEMLKSKSGAAGKTPATCSAYCVSFLGGKFVLSTKEQVYHLDDQETARKFIGAKVKVHGALDPATKSIHVESIEPE